MFPSFTKKAISKNKVIPWRESWKGLYPTGVIQKWQSWQGSRCLEGKLFESADSKWHSASSLNLTAAFLTQVAYRWCATSNSYLRGWFFNLHTASEHAIFKVKTWEAMWQCWLGCKPWASHDLLKERDQHRSILRQRLRDYLLNSRRYKKNCCHNTILPTCLGKPC